ncbi:hypothetical protein RND61_12685 [Streptomyces sp. TRM76323]|uniref:VOC domain-containing protein n=1 Tax=Streptomyces tamarix TaxID=3078565 RepID=A0ABU3QJL5_9ACTN|nr:hypothetical protein [Streptomyces tamarix]MDT9682921.1 hypothetical protein [Streptomyces tamarix]
MITTDFVPGSPCRLDLGAPDTGAAAGSYRSVFGWEYRPAGPEAGGYGVFRLDGEGVAGVAAGGGTVRTGPKDAEGTGRLALCADPAGAGFVVLAPARG